MLIYIDNIIFFKKEKKFLFSQNIINPVGTGWPTKKLSPKFYKLFEIKEVIIEIAYKLQLSDQWKIYFVFHISLLKLYKTTDEFV
jgi:hypothetical protein